MLEYQSISALCAAARGGGASVGENQESIRLLHTIRNMLIGIGLMVSALGLLAFGYLFAEGTNLLQPCSSSAPCCF